jgi:hypothetical protein
MTYSGLSRAEWQTLKLHFSRERAFSVSLRDRNVFRSALDAVRLGVGEDFHKLHAIPVSTIDWSSSCYNIGGERIAFVDVEQANAINFLAARQLLNERPLFVYTEFMVRAAEALYNLGDLASALRVSSVCDDRLRDYARGAGSYPLINRPGVLFPALEKLVASNIALAFVTGHEVGHLIRSKPGAPLTWVKETYHKHETEPARHSKEGNFVRFLKPECVQKFDEDGRHVGDAVLGLKLLNRLDLQRDHFISEAHSDFFGILAATSSASVAEVKPNDLFVFMFLLLECSEMLMSLKRLLPRIPRKGAASAIAFEHTSLGFRRFMLISAIRDIRNGTLSVPQEIRRYWKRFHRNTMVDLIHRRNDGSFESVSNRVNHLARASTLFALNGHLPDAPTEKEIVERYGPFAGTGYYLYSPLKISPAWLCIDLHNFWIPSEVDETLPIGYCAALADITSILYKQEGAAAHSASRDEALARIRHPRVQTFQRRVFDL